MLSVSLLKPVLTAAQQMPQIPRLLHQGDLSRQINFLEDWNPEKNTVAENTGHRFFNKGFFEGEDEAREIFLVRKIKRFENAGGWKKQEKEKEKIICERFNILVASRKGALSWIFFGAQAEKKILLEI